MLLLIPFLLVPAFVLWRRKKMKRSTCVWVWLVFGASLVAVVTAGISWDAHVRKAPSHKVVDYVCLCTAGVATVSILPSLLWAVILVALKRWEESIAMTLMLLLGFSTFWVSTSSWPILRV